MDIRITAREIMDKGLWDKFCELKGISVWAVNEGQVDSSEAFLVTEEESKELGLIK